MHIAAPRKGQCQRDQILRPERRAGRGHDHALRAHRRRQIVQTGLYHQPRQAQENRQRDRQIEGR